LGVGKWDGFERKKAKGKRQKVKGKREEGTG
jgi:uncharacterized protein YjbJ (UPF0337 family)